MVIFADCKFVDLKSERASFRSKKTAVLTVEIPEEAEKRMALAQTLDFKYPSGKMYHKFRLPSARKEEFVEPSPFFT